MDPATDLPATLNDAIATEPVWLQAWVLVLVVVNLAALLFVVGRQQGRWLVRFEPIAIVVSFVAAGLFMGWLYEQVGYVRLLGLAHLFCWGPVWVWVLWRRHTIGTATLFGKYVHLYLLIAGASLLIDAVDVVRYLVGDGELLHRWSWRATCHLACAVAPALARAPSRAPSRPDRRRAGSLGSRGSQAAPNCSEPRPPPTTGGPERSRFFDESGITGRDTGVTGVGPRT